MSKEAKETKGSRDIRSFFGGQASVKKKDEAAKPAAKRPIEAVDLTGDSTDDDGKGKQNGSAAKRPKTADKPASKAKPAAKTSPVAAKPTSNAKPAAKASPVAAKPKNAASKASNKKKARTVESSDDDADEDYDVEDAIALDLGEDDDFMLDMSEDEIDEPVKKPAKSKAAPAAKKEAPSRPQSASAKPSATKPAAAKPGSANPAAAESKSAPKKPTPKRKKEEKPEISPSAKAAMAAVDAAAVQLPEIKIDLMEEGNFGGGGGGDNPPPHAGEKEVPRGHPECLDGKTFVISGTLDSLWRNEAEDLIKRHSGRVTGSVSGKTSFLVCGTGCGRKKVATAQDKGTKVIDEDGLFALIRAAPDLSAAAVPKQPAAQDAQRPSSAVARPSSGTAKPPGSAAQQGWRPAPQAQAGPGPGSSGAAASNGQLWVEKHKPQESADLIGNPTTISTLRDWLRQWDRVHLKGMAPEEPKGRGKAKDLSKKSVLLSGPPGIGKTSSAMIITRELGYLPVEVNASDTRNKADASALKGVGGKLANSIKELATNSAIGFGADGQKKRICLIMDEVDGMSGGDRGGVTELINTIKRSKVPIICICNDKYNQKLKSLRNGTLELEFRKPTSQQIVKRLAGICRKEGLNVNDSTLMALAEGGNCDIRLIMGQLQMIRLRKLSLSYDEAKGRMGTSKDADMSPFEAGRKLLSAETARWSLGDRMDLVFQDMDLVPLLLQENYLNHRPTVASDDKVRLRMVAKAAEAFSAGDVVNRSVRQYQNWSLMPFAAVIGSVMPSTYVRGSREAFGLYPTEMNFPRFTAWLGNNSSQGKQRRLLGELHTRLSASGACTTDRTGLRTTYLPTFRQALTKPLVEHDKDGIQPVVSLMQEYCLNKDDHAFILDVTQFKTKAEWNEDLYKKVPVPVKSAFTRQFNQVQATARPKSNIMVEGFKRKRGKTAATDPDADPELAEGGGDPEIEAAEAAAAKAAAEGEAEEEAEDEELDPKDVAALAKKEKQMARRGFDFAAKGGSPKGKKAAPKKPAGRGGGRGSGAGSGRGKGRGAKAK